MTIPTFLDELLQTIESDIARGGGTVHKDTELLLEGIVDSLGLVRLVAWIEERANVEIDPTELVLENFASPAIIDAFVHRLLSDV